MPQLRYLSAGESHGKSLTGIIEGMPAGLSLIASRDIDPILIERQRGYGRSYRQKIEDDRVEILSGVRFGITTGAPIALKIDNADNKNWGDEMSVISIESKSNPVTIPRPGHADLAGAIKYQHDDIRNVLERASARETAMRVAVGAVASRMLSALGIFSVAYVKSIGAVSVSEKNKPEDSHNLLAVLSKSELRMYDSHAEAAAKSLIDEAKKSGDTLGGVVEISFSGIPIGIGSYVQWDRKLDGLLAQALMSIQAVKSVEIGDGLQLASRFGGESHDEIIVENGFIARSTNRAGGIEGGMSNGMPIVLRLAMKPISTLMQPLQSINLATGLPTTSHIERSDVCAVPSLATIAEQVAAFTIASALLDTFGGDTITELSERVERRREQSRITIKKV
ncbi:MAG: chorismate synthase [bacterium]